MSKARGALRRRRCHRVAAALGVLVVLAGCRGQRSGGEATHQGVQRIVLVTIDTLRADHVGCYGDAQAGTPTLDGLATHGVRFQTAISAAPLTLPSHTTILTGLDPPQHGVRDNGTFRLAPGIPTLATHLKKQGFATAAFVSAYVLDHQFGLAQGFDVYGDHLGLNAVNGSPVVPHRRGDATVDRALQWVRSAPDRFFLWVHLYDPHAPYAPPEPFATRFATHPYDGEIAFADEQLGRLLRGIRSRWSSGTLVAVTADHGESLGEHDEDTHAFTLYDATQHVPLLIEGPGVPAGRVVRGPVGLSRIAATLLDLAGLPPLPGHVGTSLVPAIRSGDAGDQPAYMETLATQLDMGWSPLLGVRTRRFAYIKAPRPELYDVSKDPHELHNIVDRFPKRAAALDRIVDRDSGNARVSARVELDAGQRARLEALGYIVSSGDADRQDLGKVGGTNPRDVMGEVRTFNHAAVLVAKHRGREALAKLAGIQSQGYEIELLRSEAALLALRPALGIRHARIAIQRAPHAEAFAQLGDAYLADHETDQARAAYTRANRLDPKLSQAWIGLGRVEELEGHRVQARRDYQQALQVPLPMPEAIWRLAALDIETGHGEASRTLLARLPQSALRAPDAAVRLAQAEIAAGKPGLARIRLEGSLRASDKAPAVWLALANLDDREGKLKEALEARESALARAPDAAAPESEVAGTLARMGRDLDRALTLARSAIQTRGRRPELLGTLAMVHVARGEYQQALAVADEALQHASARTRSEILFRRAEALAGLGQRAEALASLEEAAKGPEESGQLASEARERVTALLARSHPAKRSAGAPPRL